jgi:hypothetical protein
MTLAALILAVAAPLLVMRLVVALSRRAPDDKIDALIRVNGARWRDGMERPDWRRIESIGARNAEAVWQAEGRGSRSRLRRVR